MSDAETGPADEAALDRAEEATDRRWSAPLWWATLVAVLAVAIWDAALAMQAPNDGIGLAAERIVPLLLPLGLAWWGRRSDNPGFGVLALAVVAVEVLVIRLGVMIGPLDIR